MAGATLSLAVSALIRELLLQNWALCSGSFTLTVAQKRVAVFPVTKSDQNTQTVKQNAFLLRQNKTGCKRSRESSFQAANITKETIICCRLGSSNSLGSQAAGRAQPAADSQLYVFVMFVV